MQICKKIFLFLVLQGAGQWMTYAQELPALELRIAAIHTKLVQSKMEAERFAANDSLLLLFDEALSRDTELKYHFDSLKAISILRSDDKKLRIFTWFVPHQDGHYTYYGIIQAWNERYKRYDTFWLEDKSDKMDNPEEVSGDAENWYGALYYKMIEVHSRGKTYYTLLGWDGADALHNRKVIEVLSLRQSGSPVFGYYIFRNYPSKAKRILFEYSQRASMTLRYDQQGYYQKFRKRNKKLKVKEIISDMIVFDRLIPLEPGLQGQYQFYVPESNIFDAFILKNNRWELIRDIDARNTEQERDRQPAQLPERGLFPPKQ